MFSSKQAERSDRISLGRGTWLHKYRPENKHVVGEKATGRARQSTCDAAAENKPGFSSLTGPESFPQEQLSAHFSGLEGFRNDPEIQIINTLVFILTEAFLSPQSQTIREATSFSFQNLHHCFGSLSFMNIIADELIQGNCSNKINGEQLESW